MFLNIQNQKRSWTDSSIGHITTKSYVVDCLNEYLKCRNTKVQTDTKALCIRYEKPFRAAAIDSVRR